MFDGVKPASQPGLNRGEDTYELKTTSVAVASTSGYVTFSQVAYLSGQVLGLRPRSRSSCVSAGKRQYDSKTTSVLAAFTCGYATFSQVEYLFDRAKPRFSRVGAGVRIRMNSKLPYEQQRLPADTRRFRR